MVLLRGWGTTPPKEEWYPFLPKESYDFQTEDWSKLWSNVSGKTNACRSLKCSFAIFHISMSYQFWANLWNCYHNRNWRDSKRPWKMRSFEKCLVNMPKKSPTQKIKRFVCFKCNEPASIYCWNVFVTISFLSGVIFWKLKFLMKTNSLEIWRRNCTAWSWARNGCEIYKSSGNLAVTISIRHQSLGLCTLCSFTCWYVLLCRTDWLWKHL